MKRKENRAKNEKKRKQVEETSARQDKSKSNREQTNKNNRKTPTIVTKILFQLPYDIQATLSIQT